MNTDDAATGMAAVELAAEGYQKGYAEGHEDGQAVATVRIFDLIEGRNTRQPDANYSGPLPAELREWIDHARDAIARHREHHGA